MTSLLKFSLRRRNSAERIPESSSRAVTPPPDMAAAISGDSEEVHDTSFITVMEAPQTPDGLRPRPSFEELMDELDIHPRVAPMRHLPPRHPSASPQVSTSSFYTRTTGGTLIAESPDLSVGRARTAVGAIVAQQQPFPVQHSAFQAQFGELGVLPPRGWIQEAEHEPAEDLPYYRLDDSLEVLTPSRARRTFMSENSVSSTADASSIHASPSTWRHYQQYQEESYSRVQQQQRNDVNISFSSRLGLVEDVAIRENGAYNFESISAEQRDDNESRREFVVAATDQLTNVSGISQSTTGPSEKWTWGVSDDVDGAGDSHQSSQADGRYEEQEAMDSALLQRKALNQQRRKERLVLDLVQRLQDDTDLVAGLDDLHNGDDSLNHVFLKTPMDREGLLVGYNQDKRNRLVGTVEKLLHEMDVAQPEEFFMSPTHIHDFADTHNDLRQALLFLVPVVRTAIPENERGILNVDKRTTSSLVDSQLRWIAQEWLRSSFGIQNVPESPETVRGGDTSLFSLPSESCDTPHTSNVSMTTTIPSRLSPGVSSPEPHRSQKLRRTLEIAATLLQKLTLACDELVLLDRAASNESIRATELIKRIYLQLMALPFSEINSLVNAFSQEIPRGSTLARIVSEDDNEIMHEETVPVSPPRSRSLVSLQGSSHARPVIVSGTESTNMTCGRPAQFNLESRDFFSPVTADMESRWEDEEERDYCGYMDDLRRDVGSYDCDEREGGDCERDGPDETNSSEDFSELYNGHDNTGAFPSVIYESMENSILHDPCVGEV